MHYVVPSEPAICIWSVDCGNHRRHPPPRPPPQLILFHDHLPQVYPPLHPLPQPQKRAPPPAPVNSPPPAPPSLGNAPAPAPQANAPAPAPRAYAPAPAPRAYAPAPAPRGNAPAPAPRLKPPAPAPRVAPTPPPPVPPPSPTPSKKNDSSDNEVIKKLLSLIGPAALVATGLAGDGAAGEAGSEAVAVKILKGLLDQYCNMMKN
ncbi:hypothetical protein ABKV19_010615 [Rosa sericea]